MKPMPCGSKQQAAFIDVLPRPPRPQGLPASTIWHPKAAASISPTASGCRIPATAPSHPSWRHISQLGLAQASAGDHGRMLVFYCLENCWMSWNAAKRAMALGYTMLRGIRDGTDGWTANGFPTEAREPVPRPSDDRMITPVPAGSDARARTAAVRSCLGTSQA